MYAQATIISNKIFVELLVNYSQEFSFPT